LKIVETHKYKNGLREIAPQIVSNKHLDSFFVELEKKHEEIDSFCGEKIFHINKNKFQL